MGQKIEKRLKEYLKKLGSATLLKILYYGENLNKHKSLLNSLTSFLLKTLVLLTVFLAAFYPELLENIFILVVGILIFLIIIYLLFNLILPAVADTTTYISMYLLNENLNVSEEAKSFISKLTLIILVFVVVVFFPTPNYRKLFEISNIPPIYYFIFMLFSLLFVLLISTTEDIKFLFASILYVFVLYFAIPFLLIISSNVCLETNPIYKIPYISNAFSKLLCRESRLQKTSLVVREKEVKVPSSGGLSISIGYGKLNYLPAGHTYREFFYITNNYIDPENPHRGISIHVTPYIYYPRYNLYFIPKNFVSKTGFLRTGETYADVVSFDPGQLEIEGRRCSYTKNQLENLSPLIECAYDLPCPPVGGIKSACIEIGRLKCKCINWVNVTCSGDSLHMVLNVSHDGFIIGNGTLYYYEDVRNIGDIIRYSYSQGPATISFSFAPNPWIRSLYEGYIGNIEMFGYIQIYGYQPKIKSYEIIPINTKAIIFDYLNNKKIIETIGISPIYCVTPEEINNILSETGRWSGVFCSFTPPQITLEIIDMSNEETEFNASISLVMLNEYCKQSALNISNILSQNISNILPFYEEYLMSKEKIKNLNEDLRTTIDNYGVCSLLNKTYEEMDKRTLEQINMVRKALKEVNVYIRIEYETTQSVQSRSIPVYWTSKCE